MSDIIYRSEPTLARFHASNAFVRAVMGPIRSGKSVGSCNEILSRGREQSPDSSGVRRTRWAAIRTTYPELKTTTLKTWQDWAPQEMCPIRYDTPINGLIQQRLKDGSRVWSEIYFIAIENDKDIGKLLSLELTGAWVNEAREMTRGVIDMLTGRVRQYPPMRDGGPTWGGLIMDTNAPDTDHWWYTLFEEERPSDWVLFRQPSALSPEAENVSNLPEGYYDQVRHGKKKEWVSVYLEGKYGYVAEGKPVYPDFNESFHVAHEPITPSRHFPIIIGMDFGLTPAAIFMQRLDRGRWIWFHELCAKDMGAVSFARELKRDINHFWPNRAWQDPVDEFSGEEEPQNLYDYEFWGDPAGDERSQVRENETVFAILRANGIPAQPAPSQDHVLRKEAVSEPLTRVIDGKPGLMIGPNMPMCRKGLMGGYCYKRKLIGGGDRYHDKPDKNLFSHPIEGGEYGMLGAGEGRRMVQPLAGAPTPIPVTIPRELDSGYGWMGG